MSETRPSNHAEFAERLRNAEARRLKELESAQRRPRIDNKKKRTAMRMIEDILDQRKIDAAFREVWEDLA